MVYNSLIQTYVPCQCLSSPTLGDFCNTLIGKADIEESKSNVAMNTWLLYLNVHAHLRSSAVTVWCSPENYCYGRRIG